MLRTVNTKEAILQRLISHAAELWGIQNVEDLDPVVMLLMQGLSSLIYDIHHEVEDMNVRILESLAKSLTPSVYTDPRPAHCVAQAFPAEPVVLLDRKTAFYDNKPLYELRERGIRFFTFVPVKQVRLVSGEIKYLICERNFYRIEKSGEKRPSGQARIVGEKTNSHLWIGMDLHPEIETLEGLSFFIDFPRTTNKYEKYSLLPYSRWSIDGQPLTMRPGLPDLDDDGELMDEPYLNRHELLNRADRYIENIYSVQYLTVGNDVRLCDLHKEAFPSEISDMFPEHITTQAEPCYWIKVVLPVNITAQDINDMTVYINAFPIAQKALYSLSHKVKETSAGIIPLRMLYEGEYFIGMEDVSDSYGKIYRPLPYTIGQKIAQAGTYSIKRGGVERFDSRNAGEYLERLIILLRDEVAAFSSFNVDSLRSIVDEMQEGLKQLEIRYQESPVREFSVPDYLLLNREKNDKAEILFVEYWSTHCERANGLRSGKILTSSASLPIVRDSCRLLGITRGGKFPADVSGRMDAFRYVLTSRDQLVTQEDIKNFFRYELGDKITRVEIKRGVAVSPKPKEGLIRTIDVYLMPSRGNETIVTEMQGDLLATLRSKSPEIYIFRIKIETRS